MAEFSRDIDFSILASANSLKLWNKALKELQAEPIFFPPFKLEYLQRGHVCHFRCHHPEADGFRVDVLGHLRGCADFPTLLERCNVFELPLSGEVTVISLPDLVDSKKTRRDKDWVMLRRLVEVDYINRRETATEEDILFWLRKCRTLKYLRELAMSSPHLVLKVKNRPWLKKILESSDDTVEDAIEQEMKKIKQEDEIYWKPLIRELETMRQERQKNQEKMTNQIPMTNAKKKIV